MQRQWNGTEKAADHGRADAQFILGVCFAFGQGVEKDCGKAAEWFQKAADHGRADAQFILGACFKNGQGVDEDHFKAVEWYQKAADQGHAGAQFNLGVSYENGEGVAKDYAKAVEWFQKAADHGRADAQLKLGFCYNSGHGVKQDYGKAVEWYQKAAYQGRADAQFILGACFMNGVGVKQDNAKAVEWYQKAADQGDASAQYNLGVCYRDGLGLKINKPRAFELFQQAAANGSKEAQDLVASAPTTAPQQQVSVDADSFSHRLCDIIETDDNFSPIPGLHGPVPTFDEAVADLQNDDELRPFKLTINFSVAKMAARKVKKMTPNDPLDVDQIAAIQLYTQESPIYVILNERLRDRDRTKLKSLTKFVILLLDGLYSLKKERTVVHRGVKKSLGNYFEKGEAKIWWSFTSVTTHVEVLQNAQLMGTTGERTLFTIEAEFAIDIGRYSAVPREREMMLPPASVVEVVSKLDLGHGLHQVQLRQLPYEKLR
jgi:TPR repeat protein